ncbi:MAG TPA: hydrogenase expression/formation protein HypE [Candidatus Bathyarchaeia archaeon]|nr:hydrogenase expression/formation protein HypE [Candidatus Bathyarchaeia archaeon]
MEDSIKLEHGAGGEGMHELLKLVLSYFNFTKVKSNDGAKTEIEVPLQALDDSAVVDNIVFTTDSHTVKPLFFPGGDIGTLAIAGTVNDIAVMGAEPLCLSVAFVIEEGFSLNDFERVLEGMRKTCEEAEVAIVTGDTKVVERGAVEKIVVNTSAIGRRTEALDKNMAEVRKYRELAGNWLVDSNLRDGDKIIVSGYIGDHGVALLSFREGFEFDTELKSDIAPLNKPIQEILEVGGVVAMKDPTRGGLANSLNEFSEKSNVGILIEEEKIPVRESVRSACEMLGIDPLEVGNEGKMVMGVVKEKADDVLDALRRTKQGKDAAIIGSATKELKGVVMKTRVGGMRIVETPIGDPVPRIC